MLMSIHAEKLIKFINDSPSCFHVIENIKAKLLEAGFSELREGAKWDVVPGGKYFVTKKLKAVAEIYFFKICTV